MAKQGYWHTNQRVHRYIKELETEDVGNNSVSTILLNLLDKYLSCSCSTPHTIVDIGCGPGIVSQRFINKFGFKELIAIDLSEEMLNSMPWFIDIEKTRTTMQRADMQDSRIEAKDMTADVAICCRTFLYVESIENIFVETSRVLKVGGLFGFSMLIHTEQGVSSHFCERSTYPMDTFAHSEKMIVEYCSRLGFEILYRDGSPRFTTLSKVQLEHCIFVLKKI